MVTTEDTVKQPQNQNPVPTDVLDSIPWEGIDVSESVPWWVAVLCAGVGAVLTALRPIVRWTEDQYAKRCEHLRELEKARIEADRRRIEEMTRLIAAVEKLSGQMSTLTQLREGR